MKFRWPTKLILVTNQKGSGTATPGGRLGRGWPPDRQGSGTARLGGRLGWFSPSWRGQRGGHLLQVVAVGWVSYGRWWGALPVQIWEKKKKKKKKISVDFWQKISLHQIFGKNCVGYKRPKVSCFKQKTPKSKEQREKKEQREEEREKFSEEMRGERNFRNKYQLVYEWGQKWKILIF